MLTRPLLLVAINLVGGLLVVRHHEVALERYERRLIYTTLRELFTPTTSLKIQVLNLGLFNDDLHLSAPQDIAYNLQLLLGKNSC